MKHNPLRGNTEGEEATYFARIAISFAALAWESRS